MEAISMIQCRLRKLFGMIVTTSPSITYMDLGLMAMVTPSNQVYTYHFNAVGSTIAMTDASQAMVNKYVYDAFGNVLNKQEGISQPFKFVGQHGVMTEPNNFYYMENSNE